MPEENSDTLYTVIITGLKPGTDKIKVAEGIERIIKNLDKARTLKKLESLPWTMTRKASRKTAGRLVKYLSRLNCIVEVFPPFDMPAFADVAETQILPGTALLSEDQIASATQFLEVPKDSENAAPRADSIAATGFGSPLTSQDIQEKPDDVSLEPLTLGGILDKTFQVCRNHFWKFFAITAVPWLITGIVAVILAALVYVLGVTIKDFSNMPITMLIIGGLLLIPSAIIVFICLLYMGQGAMIYAVSSSYLGRRISVKESYSFVFDRLGKFVFTSMLLSLVIIGTVLAMLIAGVAFYYFFGLITPSGWFSAVTWLPLFCILIYIIVKLTLFDKVIIIEDIAYSGALKRSWRLVSGKAEGPWPRSYWVRLVILLNLFILVSVTISWVFQMPAYLVVALFSFPQIVTTVLTQVMSNLGQVLGGMFGAVGLVIFYYDVRNRKEGFDLQVLAKINES